MNACESNWRTSQFETGTMYLYHAGNFESANQGRVLIIFIEVMMSLVSHKLTAVLIAFDNHCRYIMNLNLDLDLSNSIYL